MFRAKNWIEWNGNCHWGRLKTAKFSNWCTSPRVRLHRRRRRRRIRANWLLSCHDTKLNKRDYKPQLDGAYKHWLTSHQRNHFDSIETEMHCKTVCNGTRRGRERDARDRCCRLFRNFHESMKVNQIDGKVFVVYVRYHTVNYYWGRMNVTVVHFRQRCVVIDGKKRLSLLLLFSESDSCMHAIGIRFTHTDCLLYVLSWRCSGECAIFNASMF